MCDCNSNMPGNSGCNDYSLLTVNTGIAQITTADPTLTGAGATQVMQAAAGGTLVKSITIKAIAPVTTGMVRLYVKSGGGITLYKEVPIPEYPVLNATPHLHLRWRILK